MLSYCDILREYYSILRGYSGGYVYIPIASLSSSMLSLPGYCSILRRYTESILLRMLIYYPYSLPVLLHVVLPADCSILRVY